MKEHTPCARALLFGLIALLCCLMLPGPSRAAGPGVIVPDGELTVSGHRRVGSPVKAIFDLKGYTLPPGSYTSVNVRFARRPDGPEPKVRPGYPETILEFSRPGTYRLVFILNEVSKPSCGGVNARTLMETEVELTVAE